MSAADNGKSKKDPKRVAAGCGGCLVIVLLVLAVIFGLAMCASGGDDAAGGDEADEGAASSAESDATTEEDDELEIEHDDYDNGGLTPGGVTWVRFDIADNFSQGLIASGAQTRTCEAIEAALEEQPETGQVSIEGSFPTMDDHGNEGDSVILRAVYNRDTLDSLNMDNCAVIDIWEVRDGGGIHPDLLDNA